MVLAKDILLVDGYNIIHAWDSLKIIAETDSLENARLKLLEEMSNLQGFYQNEVIVVFDAHKIKKGQRKKLRFHNIEVVYTKDNETADHYIERVAANRAKNAKIRVATSDGLEQIIILAQGATRVSAKELEEELQQVKEKNRKKYIEKTKINNNRLEGHLSEAVLNWMEKKRRE